MYSIFLFSETTVLSYFPSPSTEHDVTDWVTRNFTTWIQEPKRCQCFNKKAGQLLNKTWAFLSFLPQTQKD